MPVIAASLLLLGACGDDDAPAPPSTTTTSSTTIVTTTTTADSPEPAAVDVTAALLQLGDLPAQWSAADDSVGEVEPATGFCGNFVNVRALDELRTRPFAASDIGPWVVSGIAVFDSAGAAQQYLEAIDGTLTCERWTDDSGVENRARRIERRTTRADEVRAFEQIATVETASFTVDVVYLRTDRAVAFVTFTRRTDTTAGPEGGDSLDLGSVVGAVARRLTGAVEG